MSQLLNIFEISFGVFDKRLVMGMLNNFRLNNQFIDLRFFICRLIEKNLCKIGYYYGYCNEWSWQSQLKGFYKMQYIFKIKVLSFGFIGKG